MRSQHWSRLICSNSRLANFVALILCNHVVHDHTRYDHLPQHLWIPYFCRSSKNRKTGLEHSKCLHHILSNSLSLGKVSLDIKGYLQGSPSNRSQTSEPRCVTSTGSKFMTKILPIQNSYYYNSVQINACLCKLALDACFLILLICITSL